MYSRSVIPVIFLLAACGASGGDQVALENLRGCDAVRTLAQGMSETVPFASLVQDPEEDAPFQDQKVTVMQPWDTGCTYGVIPGWNEGDSDSHVFRCHVFEASSMMFEEAKADAEASFARARADLDQCLGEAWTSRVIESNSGAEAETVIYERASDIERSESTDFYLYPVMLRKAFFRSPEPNGGPWGWIVDVAFQQQADPLPDD